MSKTDEEVVQNRAFEVLTALTSLVWSLERGISVQKSFKDAQRVVDKVRRERINRLKGGDAS